MTLNAVGDGLLLDGGPDEVELEDLYRRYRATVYAYLRRMTGDAEEAEDLTQEVFLKAHRRPPSGAKARYPRAWLLQVATYTCIDHFRRRRARIAAQPEPDDLQDPWAVDPFEQSQTAAAVSESLRRLPARHRAAIILKDIHGLKHAEIAAAMNISEGAAQVLLHRARGEFRKIFLGLSPIATGCPVAHRLATELVGVDLTLQQRRELREHAKTCPECAQRFEEGRVPAGALGFLLAPLYTPTDILDRLTPMLPNGSWVPSRPPSSWVDRAMAQGVPTAESALRVAAPAADQTIQLSAKVGAVLVAVALAGAGSLGAIGLGARDGTPSPAVSETVADQAVVAPAGPTTDSGPTSGGTHMWAGVGAGDPRAGTASSHWGPHHGSGPYQDAPSDEVEGARSMLGRTASEGGGDDRPSGATGSDGVVAGGGSGQPWTTSAIRDGTGLGSSGATGSGTPLGVMGETQGQTTSGPAGAQPMGADPPDQEQSSGATGTTGAAGGDTTTGGDAGSTVGGGGRTS